MNLNPGARVGIVNYATDLKKWDPNYQAPLSIHELHEYKGQLIVLGSTAAGERRIPLHGMVQTKMQRSSPVVLRGETDINICRMVEYLKGRPLMLAQGNELLLVLNCATLGPDLMPTEWVRGLDMTTQNGHLVKSARVIDRWLELKSSGRLAQLPHRRDMTFSQDGRLLPAGKNRSLWAPNPFVAPLPVGHGNRQGRHKRVRRPEASVFAGR